MKKEYKLPILNFFNVTSIDIIITSDIIIGDDTAEGTTDAPSRSDGWNEYHL